jgi:hypothetical protein
MINWRYNRWSDRGYSRVLIHTWMNHGNEECRGFNMDIFYQWTLGNNLVWKLVNITEAIFYILVTSYHYQWQTRRSLWRSARFRTACGSRAVPLRHPQTLAWGWLLGMEPLLPDSPHLPTWHGRGKVEKEGGCWGHVGASLYPVHAPPMLKACWDQVDLLRGRMSCKHRVIDHTWYA